MRLDLGKNAQRLSNPQSKISLHRDHFGHEKNKGACSSIRYSRVGGENSGESSQRSFWMPPKKWQNTSLCSYCAA